MSATHILFNLLGDIALLLWGIHMVHSGVMRAYGSALRRLLAIGLKDRLRAFLAGVGVTTLLQSSTATALMASSFTAGGVVALVPALAIVLGANVGTTLIVQVLSFDITLVFPALIFVGVVVFRGGGQARLQNVGRIAIGLGLMLLSLHLLGQTMKPIEAAPETRDLLRAITRDPVLNAALAAAFTWAAHSSVASVLFITSLSQAGIVTPEAALAMVVGANLGSALNPVFEGTSGDPVKLRVPICNLASRLIGCALVLPFADVAATAFSSFDPDPARLAANFHTVFNVALAALFILPLPAIARLLKRLLPEKVRATDPGQPQYLDRSALETPSVALTNTAREVLRMADTVETMLRGSLDLFHLGDLRRVKEISRMDDILDRLHGAIQRYLAAISYEALGDEEARRLSEILAFSINLEHVGDIIDKNLMELAAKRIRLQLTLSQEGLVGIDEMHTRLIDHLQLAVAVFMWGDIRSARLLVAQKDKFRDLERAMTGRHFAQLQKGRTEGLETSTLQLDIARDLKRIEAHIAATAYPLLEQSGELKPSRLTEEMALSGTRHS